MCIDEANSTSLLKGVLLSEMENVHMNKTHRFITLELLLSAAQGRLEQAWERTEKAWDECVTLSPKPKAYSMTRMGTQTFSAHYMHLKRYLNWNILTFTCSLSIDLQVQHDHPHASVLKYRNLQYYNIDRRLICYICRHLNIFTL